MGKEFFPSRPELCPMIYAYEDLNPDYEGLLKIGYTEVDVDRRVVQPAGVVDQFVPLACRKRLSAAGGPDG